MLPVAVQIIPHLSPRDVCAAAVEAEALGYSAVWVSDEGFMVEPFTVLGMIAAQTSRIGLGVITNPYTRHPAMTAAAIATLDAMSGGRAALCYVSGGSLVLDPLRMGRPQPVQTMQEALTLTRLLLSGERVTWAGERFQLEGAQLEVPTRPDLALHVAARGPKMLAMAAQYADAVWTTTDADTLNMIRAAAGERHVQLVCGEHTPINDSLDGNLAEAVEQDGTMKEAAPQAPLDEWAAGIHARAALMDEFLIVTWERSLQRMLYLLRAVKEALS